MQFVGPPFTFSIRQVGTNCGCIGQHAAAYADGKVYWMGLAGGFFVFDGTVKNLPSLVEDFVFQTDGDNLGVNYNSNEISMHLIILYIARLYGSIQKGHRSAVHQHK